MEGNIERDCSVLGGLFQAIINDMKNSVPVWEDFSTKATKLHSQLKTTILCVATFLESFQRLADIANNSRGATKELGAALTRLTLRHKTIELKLKSFSNSIMECLVIPLQERMEDWRKITAQLDKEHAKEYKKARQDIKKKSSDTIRLQKKARKGKTDVQYRLDSAMQDVNDMYILLEEAEKNAVRNSLIEERSRFCFLVQFLRPVVEEEVSMLSEVSQLQGVLEELTVKSKDPYVLPPASEQVILDIKGQDGSKWSFPTPPSSPTTSNGSRKSSICSLGSINSSDSRSSGSMNSHSPSSNSYHRHRSMSQPNPSHRLSSVSSQDSGFTSQDTLFLRPGTPPHSDMLQSSQKGSPTESPIEEQPGNSSSECSTPSPGFPHPSGGFPTPTPTSGATTPVIGGSQRVMKPQVPLSTVPNQVPNKVARPPGPVRRHSEVSIRAHPDATLRSPSSMPNFDNPQPNQVIHNTSSTLPRKQAKRLKLPAFSLLPLRFKLMRSPRHNVQVELKRHSSPQLNTPLQTPLVTPLPSPVVPRPVFVAGSTEDVDEDNDNEPSPLIESYRMRSATLPNRRHTTSISPAITSSLDFALARGLGADSEADHGSLQCSSGYNTQSTTPTHSGDTINSQDTDYYSMDGDGNTEHALQDYEKTATIPRTGDPSYMYTGRQRPMSMACVPSTITEGGMISPQGTLRRKPPPPIRRTPSGGSLTGMDLAVAPPPSSQFDSSGTFKVPLPVASTEGRNRSVSVISQPEFAQQREPPPKMAKPVGRSQSLRLPSDATAAMSRLSLMESLNARLAQRQPGEGDVKQGGPVAPPPVASKPSLKPPSSQAMYQQSPSYQQPSTYGQNGAGYQPNAYQQQQQNYYQQQQPNAYQQPQQQQQDQQQPASVYQPYQQQQQQVYTQGSPTRQPPQQQTYAHGSPTHQPQQQVHAHSSPTHQPQQQQQVYTHGSPTHQPQQQVYTHSSPTHKPQQQTPYQHQQQSSHYQPQHNQQQQQQSYQQHPYQQQQQPYQQQPYQQQSYQQNMSYGQSSTDFPPPPQSLTQPGQTQQDSSSDEEEIGTGHLSEIKRGVKLRRTISSDRSAPKI